MRIFIFLMLAMSLTFCTSQTEFKHFGELIETPGIYHYEKEKDLSINIYARGNLVQYEMLDSTGKQLLKNRYDFTKFTRWAFYLDDKKRLWVFSSDIGISVWSKNVSNNYTEHILDRRYNISVVPNEILKQVERYF